MSKPARGSKRVCPSCGARFYDLSRTPIVCPVCQTVYQVTPPPSRRGERAARGAAVLWMSEDLDDLLQYLGTLRRTAARSPNDGRPARFFVERFVEQRDIPRRKLQQEL